MKIIYSLNLVLFYVLSSASVYVSAAASNSNEVPADAFIETKNFTVERSLKSLTAVTESLESLKKIITRLENEEIVILKNFKHTDWEMQNIGIPNSLSTIKGTLLHQKYRISKLKYELAMQDNSESSTEKAKLKNQLLTDKNNYEKYQGSVRRVD